MSLADELLADLEGIDGNDEEPQDVAVDSHQNSGTNGEDEDTEMVNGEEVVGGGLVLEGMSSSRNNRSLTPK